MSFLNASTTRWACWASLVRIVIRTLATGTGFASFAATGVAACPGRITALTGGNAAPSYSVMLILPTSGTRSARSYKSSSQTTSRLVNSSTAASRFTSVSYRFKSSSKLACCDRNRTSRLFASSNFMNAMNPTIPTTISAASAPIKTRVRFGPVSALGWRGTTKLIGNTACAARLAKTPTGAANRAWSEGGV